MEAMKRAEEERRKERKKNQSTIYTAEEVNYQFLAFWQLAGGGSRGNAIGGTGATTGMVMVRCIS